MGMLFYLLKLMVSHSVEGCLDGYKVSDGYIESAEAVRFYACVWE
jgi:hypothetical protein